MATVETLAGFMSVPAPVLEPVPGITQYVETLDVTDPHELMGVFYENEPVGHAFLVTPGGNDQVSASKNFGGLFYTKGVPFIAQAGVKQALRDTDDFKAKAKARFLFDENRLVEANLWATTFPAQAAAAAGSYGFAGGGDLNAAGAVSVTKALGMLEDYAGWLYGAQPIIHFPKLAGPTFEKYGLIQPGPGITKVTRSGSLVIDGRGYSASGVNTGPAGVAAGAGNAWVYVTGHIVLRRGEVDVYEAPSPSDNTNWALAERSYVPTVDQVVAAIRVVLE